MVITMLQSSSTVTSTSYKIKDLLLRAWRERWSEIEWGRNIKRLLKGVSGDVYDLADCMLRQAVNGPVTNNRLMLYLNHCLDAQIISFGACIMAITKISDLQPQCINSLLDFLNRYKTRTNCYGNDDECLALCRALVSFLHWLHTIIYNSFKSLIEYSSMNDHQTFFSQNSSNQSANNLFVNTENVHSQIAEKAINLLLFISDCAYLKALLYIGKMEEQTVWRQWLKMHQELVSKQWINSTNISSTSNDKCQIEPFINSLKLFRNKIEWLLSSTDEIGKCDHNAYNHTSPIIVAFNKMTETGLDYVPYRPLSYHSIRILISFYAILDTSCSNELLANYLIIVGRAFDLSLSRLYCETLHATLVGLIDAHNLALEDRKNINYHAWIAFLLFKIPHIFVNLNRHRIQLRKESEINLKENGNIKKTDLEIGIERLLEFEPCINQFLLRYKTDHLQKLFESFKESSINLLSNVAVEYFMKEINHRMLTSDLSTFSTISTEEQQSINSNNPVDAHITNILTLRAEQTTIQILNSLCNETCTIETLAGIICRIDNSFDIILCAAASNGLLPRFVQQFIELNRTNSYSRGENVRSSQIRAIVFDITFISLCSIVEQYGFEVIKSTNNINANDKSYLNDNSFILNWFCWNLPSSNVCYAPDIILSSYKESNKYDHLLQQLIILNSSTEFRTSLVSWDDMCIAVQFATAEVLNAWIYDAITKDMVKIFLERLKSRLCYLALSSACWLFSKLTTIIHEHQDKVLFMLNELQIPVLAQIDCSIETFASEASENNLSFGYKQRFLLMSSTLKRLSSKYIPHLKSKIENCNKTSITPLPIRLSNTSLDVLLKQCLHSTRNHFTLKLICNFDELISLGGPKWFVTQIIKYLFNYNDLANLQDSVDLAYGLFHLDLEQCAIILLKYILPEFLLSKSTEFDLIEPKLTALIRLTIITTYSAIEQLLKFQQANLGRRCGLQRKYKKKYELYPFDSVELSDNLLEHTPFYYKRREHHVSPFNHSLANGHQIQKNISNDQEELMDINEHNSTDDIEENKWMFDSDLKDNQWIMKEPLYVELVNLFQFILEQSFEYEFSPWLLVPISLMEQILLNLREDSPQFLRFVSFNLLEAMIQSSHCQSPSFEQLLAYLILDTVRSRKIGAKLICQLQLSKQYIYNKNFQLSEREKNNY